MKYLRPLVEYEHYPPVSKARIKENLMKISLLVLIAGAVLASACAEAEKPAPPKNTAVASATPAAAPSLPIPYPGVPRISLADAKADFDAGRAVFIDTHSAASFASSRIKGAINVPAGELEANLNKIPKGKKIIAYCS